MDKQRIVFFVGILALVLKLLNPGWIMIGGFPIYGGGIVLFIVFGQKFARQCQSIVAESGKLFQIVFWTYVLSFPAAFLFLPDGGDGSSKVLLELIAGPFNQFGVELATYLSLLLFCVAGTAGAYALFLGNRYQRSRNPEPEPKKGSSTISSK